jgi:hypothetical protein
MICYFYFVNIVFLLIFFKQYWKNISKESRINENLIIYIEKYIFCSINNEVIIQRFQNMKTRRNHL